jgi:RNA polymerase sigma-70 factor (ECF subfamily)
MRFSSATISTPPTLEELVRSARAGEPAAIGALYDRYAPEMFRTAYRLTGSAADAEDVVQDLFVGLPEALAHYEERGSFAAWLRRVAVRVALMRARRNRRRSTVPLVAAAGTPSGLRSDAGVEYEELHRAIMALPVGLRAVFVLKQVEGYSHDETAALLGISPGASRVRLARALDELRRSLR